jgi:hypothetical protein
MRALQSVGVIAPLVSDRGHRLFAQSDVDATLKWLGERATEHAARQQVRNTAPSTHLHAKDGQVLDKRQGTNPRARSEERKAAARRR